MEKVAHTEIRYAAEDFEYDLVILSDDRYAFIWGADTPGGGEYIPEDWVRSPLAERGAQVCETWDEAVTAWRTCAEAVAETDPDLGSKLLSQVEQV